MNQIIKIVLADDHVMVREGIKNLLELDGTIKVVGEATNGEECLVLINQLNPDVVLLDINMPKLNGLQTLEKLRNDNNNVKILMLTIHNEVEYLLKVMDLGGNGYILKDSGFTVLKNAIYSIHEGEMYIEPSLALQMKERQCKEKEIRSKFELTKREIEILKLLAEGLFNKEIGNILNISEKTVKNHVSNIFKKINVSDRTQAAVYAIRNNFVSII